METPPDRPEQDNNEDNKKAAKNPPLRRNIILRKKRKEINGTQEALANELGVSIETVRRWERGFSISESYLEELSKLLGVSKDELSPSAQGKQFLPSDTTQPSGTGQDLTDIPAPP